jgi:hypothetical protein
MVELLTKSTHLLRLGHLRLQVAAMLNVLLLLEVAVAAQNLRMGLLVVEVARAVTAI